jgi:hypothetical protein
MPAARKPVKKRVAARKTAPRKVKTTPSRTTDTAEALGRAAAAVSRQIESAVAAIRSPARHAAARRRLEKGLTDVQRLARRVGKGARKNAGKIAAIAAAAAVAAAALAASRKRS